jgi:alpha-galactosidase
LLGVIFLTLSAAAVAPAETVRLDELQHDKIRQDWGQPSTNQSVDKHPLTIAGKTFEHGVGTHAESVWWIDLGGRAERFTATVGMDEEVKGDRNSARTAVEFKVAGDHKPLFRSGRMRVGDAAKTVDVDVHGVKTLVLVVWPVGGNNNFAHADWAEGTITYSGEKPVSIEPPVETAEILTPPAPASPRINGAKVFGVRPAHSVLYTIAATGERPMTFAAENLPEGLSLDSTTGQITGAVQKPGSSIVTLSASNAKGKAQGQLRIEVGDRIALTPPMGWNSWNCFARAVSDDKVRAAADAMVNAGLINHGWTYINIDDCWEIPSTEPAENRRNADGTIKTNNKFPDMKALADYIHSKGLRAGLYSSPGPATCGQFTASYQYEEQDARQYAAWGFDYLKYDWCSYGKIADDIRKQRNRPTELDVLQHPYNVMRDALAKQDRDIVFSLCQYGMGDVWQWGEQVGGNCWRTTGDITDTWASMSGIGFRQNGHERFAGPGHWNDPDMLVVGKVGWGPALHPTRLSPNEQYTHITLWSLLSSPLLIGCDMTQLDTFTLNLLTNDEVLAVNQDPLGKPASQVHADDEEVEVWARDLSDGTKAVGLFNRGEMPNKVTAKWSELGITGKQLVRDLWRQKDIGDLDGEYTVEVPRHGAVMIRVGTPKL